MSHILAKIGIISVTALFFWSTNKIAFSVGLNELKHEILPIGSFVFAKGDIMRFGWFNWQKSNQKKSSKKFRKKPIGSIFVQLRPKKNEGEYQLAHRVLKDGAKKYNLIKELTNGKTLDKNEYLTIPFEFLKGAIQGEALKNIFPYDRVDLGGWNHHFTYDWETPELIAKSFTKYDKQAFPKKNYYQGDKLTIPWEALRSDLELQPIAIKKPLFIKKDNNGIRYAFYRFQLGDTLYSSVIIRFLEKTKYVFQNNKILYLLKLNKISNAKKISKGQIIKIPLKWIKPEFFYNVPSIYRNYFDTNAIKILLEHEKPDYRNIRIINFHNTKIISMR